MSSFKEFGCFSFYFSVLRIRDVYPGSELFPSRTRVKEFKYFNPKNGNMIRVVHPGSGSWLFTHPGSRGQKGTGSRIRNTAIFTLHIFSNFPLTLKLSIFAGGNFFCLTSSDLVYEPKGVSAMSTVQLSTRDQINFRDVTPYLTCASS